MGGWGGAGQIERAEMEENEARKKQQTQTVGSVIKASKVEETGQGQSEGSSDDEGSDNSDTHLVLTCSQKRKIYTADKIKVLFQRTKNKKWVEVVNFFTDLDAFVL